MMFECFMASTLFYLAHWQTYVTGQMKFGKFDVTEAQISMMVMMTVTSLLGKHPQLEQQISQFLCEKVVQ